MRPDWGAEQGPVFGCGAGISLLSSCLCGERAVPGEGFWRLAEFILSEGVADLVT